MDQLIRGDHPSSTLIGRQFPESNQGGYGPSASSPRGVHPAAIRKAVLSGQKAMAAALRAGMAGEA